RWDLDARGYSRTWRDHRVPILPVLILPPLLLSIFPSFAVGGAQSRFTTLANHLGSDWSHTIIAMDGVTAARERLDSNVTATFPVVENRKGDLTGNLRRFRSLIRTLAPATLLTHNFGSIEWALASRFTSVRHVHVEDGFGPEERSKQLQRRVWLRRLALRNRPTILPSQTLLEIASATWRLNPAFLHYIPNGIDLTRFSTQGQPFEWPPEKSRNGPIVGTVAALRPEKNIGRLIHAFHVVTAQTPARLLIVGDGPQRTELIQLAEDLALSDRIHFAGHVPKPDTLITSMDIFAMSSDTEQMPISLLEAMAAGCPVASTDVGDIAQMLPAAGRAFVTPCDHNALGQALLRLVRSHELRKTLGQACQLRAMEKFDQSQMFAKWSSMLKTGQT
ncbi:MAG: glycosyltransferase, partial [Janthinobacterium lividum]